MNSKLIDKLKTYSKYTLFQMIFIIFISIITALIFNFFSQDSLPISERFDKSRVNKLIIEKEENINRIVKIDANTIQNLIDNDMVVIFDLRPRQDYIQGHIPQAINFDMTKIKAGIKINRNLITLGKALVIYSNPGDRKSWELAEELLQEKIKTAYIYEPGIEDWRRNGKDVVTVKGDKVGN